MQNEVMPSRDRAHQDLNQVWLILLGRGGGAPRLTGHTINARQGGSNNVRLVRVRDELQTMEDGLKTCASELVGASYSELAGNSAMSRTRPADSAEIFRTSKRTQAPVARRGSSATSSIAA